MILEAAIVRQINTGKRQLLRIPAAGDRCPYKTGHSYALKTAQKAPVQGHITIISTEHAIFEDKPVWVLRFTRGKADEPRLLAARPGGPGGDYTSIPALAAKGAAEEVSADTQAKYATQAWERHTDFLSEHCERALDAIREIKKHAATGKQRKDLIWAEKRIEKIR